MKIFSGLTSKTPENLLLDAGAFFKNFVVGTDTFESAVTAGKLIGATKDGGEFSAVPSVSQVAVDGAKGKTKGLERLDYWDVYIKANVIEVTPESLQMALGAADVDQVTMEDYTVIKPKNVIEDADYSDNITWVGTLTGSDEPVIIQVYNALNGDGLKVTTKDKDNGVVAMTMNGHYDINDMETPPFEIYYPKRITVTPVEVSVSKAAAVDKEFTVTGGAVTAVKVGNQILSESTEVVISGESVTIKAAVFSAAYTGDYTVTFITAIGSGYAALTVTV